MVTPESPWVKTARRGETPSVGSTSGRTESTNAVPRVIQLDDPPEENAWAPRIG